MITVGQVSVGRQLDFWLNYSPGVYYFNFDGVYPLIDPEFLTDVPTIPGITSVGAVFSDSTQLTRDTKIEDLADGPSYFYDPNTNTLYVRLQTFDNPVLHVVSGGPVYAFAEGYYIDPATGTEYESRLREGVTVTRKKDALFFGKTVYQDFQVPLANADGELFDLQNWDVFGQPVGLFYGEESQPFSTFRPLRAGRVKEYTFENSLLSLAVQDSRRVLTKRVPVRTVTLLSFPEADRDENKSIPVVYGDCKKVPCRVVNDGASSPANYSFIVVDCVDHPNGIVGIDTVYVDGVEVAPGSVDLINGMFTIASANYKPGQAVAADVRGYKNDSGGLISNPLEILEDAFSVYLELTYGNLNYDTVKWEAEKTSKPSVGFAAVKSTTLADIAEAFGASTLSGLFITPDGRFTWLSNDDSAAPLFEVSSEDWLEDPVIEFSSDEALSSAEVLYDQDWNTGEFKASIYDANLEDFRLKFKRVQDGSFETVLVGQSDADSFSERLGTSYGDVQILVSGRIPLGLMNPTTIKSLEDMDPGENMDLSVDGIEISNGKIFRRTETISRFKGELLELQITPDQNEAFIKVRYIEDYDIIVIDGDSLGEFVLGDSFLAKTGVQVV